jgi:hypothetical protein
MIPLRFIYSGITAVFVGVLLWGCMPSDVFFHDPIQDLPRQTAAQGKARLEALQYNPKWYRTFDSTSDITPSSGSLLFAWSYGDLERHPDSFYVGIDTLWSLPQDVGSDTSNDWDLQVCPDGFCMNGLKVGVHGANAPIHFGDTGEFGDTSFQTEHHFQFFPAISSKYQFTAPDSSIFGALMFVRSRTNGRSDTALAFGAWKLEWDSAFLPPVRPVGGYLPRRKDFTIVNNKVRYIKATN